MLRASEVFSDYQLATLSNSTVMVKADEIGVISCLGIKHKINTVALNRDQIGKHSWG